MFFGYVDPNYKSNATSLVSSNYSTYGIVDLKNELAKYQNIANSSNQIVAARNDLIAKKNKITDTDQARLSKLLPSNIDNIRLIIEINKIAQKRNLVLKNISVGDVKTSNSIGQDTSAYGVLSMKFSVNSSYDNFLNFLSDLETNLRLLDITDISFNSTDTGFYDFNVSFNTYWLK